MVVMHIYCAACAAEQGRLSTVKNAGFAWAEHCCLENGRTFRQWTAGANHIRTTSARTFGFIMNFRQAMHKGIYMIWKILCKLGLCLGGVVCANGKATCNKCGYCSRYGTMGAIAATETLDSSNAADIIRPVHRSCKTSHRTS